MSSIRYIGQKSLENMLRLIGFKSLQERYPVDSETCSRTSLWNVNSGGEHVVVPISYLYFTDV